MTTDTTTYIKIHPEFRLNGQKYTLERLRRQARRFIDQGEPYEEAVGVFILDWLSDRRYVTVNTSGSTGIPKPIKLQKMHMVNSAKATGKHFKLPAKSTALVCLPTHYIAGKMMIVRALTLGWKLDMAQPKINPLDMVYRRYDFCAMTPMQLDNSLGRLHLLKKLIVGGGAISPQLRLRVQGIETKIYETYGMTETITHIAARRINSSKVKDGLRPFKTLENVTVTKDDRGCLVIKAPKVSTDPLITNDLVDIVTFKKFHWLGRIDNVVNSGGVKLHPERIEEVLASVIEYPFFVAGVPDELLGERLVLLVEKEGGYAFAKADIATLPLAPYEIPKEVLTTPSFLRTASGKIQRGQTLKMVIG